MPNTRPDPRTLQRQKKAGKEFKNKRGALLGEMEERYRTLTEKATFGVYVIQNNLFRYVNDACARIYGYRPHECIDTLNPVDCLVPEDRTIFVENIGKLVNGELDNAQFQCRIIRKEGAVRHAEVFGCRSMYNGVPAVLGTMVDVTEQLNAQRLLNDQYQLLQKLIDTIPLPVFYKDRKGVYRGCNIAFELSIGFPRQEIIGKTMYQFHSKELADKYEQMDEDLYANPGIQRYEFSRRFTDGTLHEVIFNKATYTNSEGDVEGLIGVIVDITDRKRTEEQLEKMSFTDELTGLYNRRGFFVLAQQQIKLAERTKGGAFLIFADIDEMKWINDTFGHQEGDRALIDAATIFKKTFRESDIVGRIGGDEFAVLIIQSPDSTKKILVKRFKQFLKLHNRAMNRSYTLSLSLGIVYCDPKNPCPFDEIVAEADRLMYLDKGARRKRNPEKHGGDIPSKAAR